MGTEHRRAALSARSIAAGLLELLDAAHDLGLEDLGRLEARGTAKTRTALSGMGPFLEK